MSLPTIVTPTVKPESKMPDAPKKNLGAKYELPESLVKNLLPEFNQVHVPKLKLPEIGFKMPEKGEICYAPRKEEEMCEPVDELSYSEWYEQQVKEYKEDMREEMKWR